MSESVAEQVPGLNPVTITAFAGLVLMVGINLAAVKVTVEELAPMWSAGLRFAAAALVLGAVVLVGRHPLPRGRALVGTLLFGFLSFAAFFAFVYLGIQRLPVGVAALVFASVPLMTFVGAVLHRLESFRWLTLAGGLLTLGGIAVMTGGTGNGSISVVGVGAMLAAAVCAAEAAIIAKRFPPVPPLVMNAIGMSIGAVILLALSFASREAHSAPREITTWLSLAYLVLVGSIATFITYLFVLRRWTASGTSYMFVLAPVVAVMFASLFQGERITFRLVAGGTLVIAGVYVGALLHIGKAKVSQRRTELAPTAVAAQAAHAELSNFPADCIRCP
jgi:drug/metabolite transporter (DMT)-like permease